MIIIFESQLYPSNLEPFYAENTKGPLDFAAHNFSKAIYNGLKENGVKVLMVNTPNIGSYPSLFRKPYVSGTKLNDGVSVDFLNIAYIKRYIIRRKLYEGFCNCIEQCPQGEEVVLLLYNFRSIPLLNNLKQKYSNIKICLIITDLPEYMVLPNHKLMRLGIGLLGSNRGESPKINLQSIDGAVLLAPRMAEKLNLVNKPWIQMEGIYECETIVEQSDKKDITILYTGNLSKRYGIRKLLDAFSEIKDKRYRLILRGSGDCEAEVMERIKIDNRVSLIPPLSREQLLKMQKEVTVLVNPVSKDEEFTHYFFPSKTLEYMASGTPVIMSHLDCVPSEYDDYLYYFDDESVSGLRNKIIEICSKPQLELVAFGKRASDFVKAYKTPKPQMKKVIEFIKTL